MVKEELSSEEKFFEKAVVTERFVKKYKKPLIAVVVAIVVFVAADIGYNINKQNTIDSANEALKELQSGKSNPAVETRLQALSPELHDLWAYSHAIAQHNVQELEKLKKSKTFLIGDMATYEAASQNADVAALQAYTERQKAIYKDLATVELAVLLMNSGKIDEAHTKLAAIGTDSPLYSVVKSLKHYGVK